MRRLAILFILVISPGMIRSQAIPSAAPPVTVQLGLGFGIGWPDNGTTPVKGGVIYGDADLRSGLGIEGEIRDLELVTPKDIGENSYLLGLRYGRSVNRLRPYGKVLVGFGTFQYQQGTYSKTTSSTYGTVAFGGGIEYLATKHLNLRLMDVEYQDWPNFPPRGLTPLAMTFGIAFRLGPRADTPSLMLGCMAEPETIFPGDTVTVTAKPIYLASKRRAVFSWATSGGTLTASNSTASIDTVNLAPGAYVITGTVAQGRKAKEQASCNADFHVKPFDPPTIACVAKPDSTVAGTTIDIVATASSPQKRALTYSYTTTRGTISDAGGTIKLYTAGLGAGPVDVTCYTVDDLGHRATKTIEVALSSAPMPAITQTQSLCQLSFTRDRRRPERADNEAKACLDDIVLSLNRAADATLVVIGNRSSDEASVSAERRAMNVKRYLTDERGINFSRIELRIGNTSGRTVDNTLVPAGAIFDDADTQSFDENAITRNSSYNKPIH